MAIILLFILIILIIINIILFTNNTNLTVGGKKKYAIKNPFKLNEKRLYFTYKIFCDDKYCQYFKNKLNALGGKELKGDNIKYADLVYRVPHRHLITNYIYDKKYNKYKNMRSNLKSTVRDLALYNKSKLAIIMKYSPHIAPTEILSNYIWKNDIIIVKKINSIQQRDVYVIIDKQHFIELKNKFLSESDQYIVSKYIANPLLYKGKKFHLRIMITVFADKNGNKKLKYMKKGIRLYLAKKEYIIKDKTDYLDPDINISGVAGTFGKMLIWPNDLSNLSSSFIQKCNKSIDDAINNIPLDDIFIYHNQKAGFDTYGGDIMLDDTGHAWLLELNAVPGFLTLEWVNDHYASFMDYLNALYDFHLNEFILPYLRI